MFWSSVMSWRKRNILIRSKNDFPVGNRRLQEKDLQQSAYHKTVGQISTPSPKNFGEHACVRHANRVFPAYYVINCSGTISGFLSNFLIFIFGIRQHLAFYSTLLFWIYISKIHKQIVWRFARFQSFICHIEPTSQKSLPKRLDNVHYMPWLLK